MKIVTMRTSELIPYAQNAKRHPPEQVEQIANSIKAFGWQQPIVVDKDNVVIIGHGRLFAAKELMLDEVPVVKAEDLTEDQVNALRLADNKTNESDWEVSTLEQELAALAIAGIDMEQFGFNISDNDGADDKYTGETKIPQYEPKDEVPDVGDLVKMDKVDELLENINAAQVSEGEKHILRICAYRHAVIDFDLMADYYASASPEMQRLMEENALVLIDYNDAIADGYTTLSAAMEEMMAGDVDE